MYKQQTSSVEWGHLFFLSSVLRNVCMIRSAAAALGRASLSWPQFSPALQWVSCVQFRAVPKDSSELTQSYCDADRTIEGGSGHLLRRPWLARRVRKNVLSWRRPPSLSDGSSAKRFIVLTAVFSDIAGWTNVCTRVACRCGSPFSCVCTALAVAGLNFVC